MTTTQRPWVDIRRGEYVLDADRQDVIAGILLAQQRVEADSVRGLVRALVKAPGPHLDLITRDFLTAMINRGLLQPAPGTSHYLPVSVT